MIVCSIHPVNKNDSSANLPEARPIENLWFVLKETYENKKKKPIKN